MHRKTPSNEGKAGANHRPRRGRYAQLVEHACEGGGDTVLGEELAELAAAADE